MLHIYLTLKNLRVACRQYAYLPMLLDMLFATVHLVASAEHAETVAKTDLSMLKQYVKSVSFEPTKESWMTKRELFDDIILVRPFEEAVHTFYDAWRIEGGYRSFQVASIEREEELKALGIRGFIEKHLPNGQELFSEEEMRAGYEAYMSRANAAKAVFDSGELASTWTKALSQLDRVERVSVGLWEWDRDSLDHHIGTHGKSWKELGPVVYGHNHPRHNGYPHEPKHCREVQAPVGKALFDAVLETLATSKTKLKQLTIDSCDTGEFAWADDARVAELDLYVASAIHPQSNTNQPRSTNLTHLTFCPRAEEIGESNSWESDRTASIEARSGKAITALLQRCAPSLTDLELFTGVSFCPNSWPPQDVDVKDLPDLPSLTNFVTATTLNLNSFPAWLKTKCRALARLELQMCHGHSYGESGWRSLWDAIRYVPSLLPSFLTLPLHIYMHIYTCI
ncbi:hypothetical protein SLS60_002514 [Paraconiothyrium brasiliense]|uniref:Uncharacterized protein n=1 Tax=Paraconiothyrium brasiliense TaxID=300254 RepID=A0ABR3S307_9PLEO